MAGHNSYIRELAFGIVAIVQLEFNTVLKGEFLKSYLKNSRKRKHENSLKLKKPYIQNC